MNSGPLSLRMNLDTSDREQIGECFNEVIACEFAANLQRDALSRVFIGNQAVVTVFFGTFKPSCLHR